MRVLVTGGTGFLGSNVCRDLAARGHQVWALGRDFSSVNLGNLNPDPASLGEAASITAINADLRDVQAIRQACVGMEAVIHCAALSSPWGRREEFLTTNLSGTQTVLEACLLAGVHRLIHISSPAVVFSGQDHSLERDDAPYPKKFSSFYALSKKLAEEFVLEAHRSNRNQLEVIVLRPKAIYGPGDRSLLPRIVAAARAGKLPQVGSGENLIDLTFIDDAVQAVAKALECPIPKTDFPVYTITSGEHVKLWAVIHRVLEGLKIDSKLRVVPVKRMLRIAGLLEAVAGVTGREPRLTRYTVELLARTQTYDISRAKSDLGFEPRVGLEAGLKRTIKAIR
jgi:2-alkyl-3-oxoalkanoate reductase